MVQRTGVGISTDSPSIPTGIRGWSASMMTSRAVSVVRWRERCAARSRPAAWAAFSILTPTTPSRPWSSRARRPAGDVPGLVGVVADQHRLRAVEYHLPVGADYEVCSLVAGQQVRQHGQRGAGFLVAVGGALHDLGVSAEGRVIDERTVADQAKVDPQLDAVGQGIQAGGGVVPVQSEIEGEVVAGACGDDHHRDLVSGGDARHKGLGSVATGHPEQVGSAIDGVPGERGHVDDPGTLQQGYLGAERGGLIREPEPRDFPAA